MNSSPFSANIIPIALLTLCCVAAYAQDPSPEMTRGGRNKYDSYGVPLLNSVPPGARTTTTTDPAFHSKESSTTTTTYKSARFLEPSATPERKPTPAPTPTPSRRPQKEDATKP
jgi:hypothetical protein